MQFPSAIVAPIGAELAGTRIWTVLAFLAGKPGRPAVPRRRGPERIERMWLKIGWGRSLAATGLRHPASFSEKCSWILTCT